MALAAEDEAEILAAIDRFLGALAGRRLDEVIDAFSEDADTYLYGSEVSEIVIGPAAIRRFFERFFQARAGPRFTLGARNVSVSGDIAWFVAECEVVVGDQTVAPYRLCGVLQRRDGRWRWRLFNGSEPRPDRG